MLLFFTMEEITLENIDYYSAPARFLSAQERRFCVLYARGYDPGKAAVEAGYASARSAENLLAKPEIQETMAMLRARITAYMGVEVTRELLTSMLFEAHATAASSTEKISAVKEIGRMHGLYEAPKVNVNVSTATRVEQLEGLTDAELARIAQGKRPLIEAHEHVAEGVYQTVEEETD